MTFGSARDLDATLLFIGGATRGRRYGARTDEGVFVGDLLTQQVPEIAGGELEIVAIARRPGELSKVAVRRRLRLQPRTPRPVPLVLGPAGERIRAVNVTRQVIHPGVFKQFTRALSAVAGEPLR